MYLSVIYLDSIDLSIIHLPVSSTNIKINEEKTFQLTKNGHKECQLTEEKRRYKQLKVKCYFVY